MGRFIWKELPSWTIIGRWSELRVVRVRHSRFQGYVGGGYCEIGRGLVPVREDAGRKIKVEEKEVGVCEEFCD